MAERSVRPPSGICAIILVVHFTPPHGAKPCTDLIKRLGKRYDGHPDIDHVDLGSVGWWGEWHMSSSPCEMPKATTQRRIVDAYLDAFQKTPLVMLVGAGEMLKYATDRGAGWRADCLGDMGGFSKTWCHMRIGYPKMLTGAEATAAWTKAPVAWETCWDMRKWVNEGWSLRYKWMPGTVDVFTEAFLKSPPDLPFGPITKVTDALNLPDDLPPGEYRLSLGVVGENREKPIVMLGIGGRGKDGWYELSRISVTK